MNRPTYNPSAAQRLARYLQDAPLNHHERRIIVAAYTYAIDGALPRRKSSPEAGGKIKPELSLPGSEDTSLAA